MIRVLVTDDNPVIREGVTALLSRAQGITVVGEAATGREAVRLTAELRPDVVLLDIRMPVMDGIEATPAISKHVPVLILSYADDEELVCGAIRAGASGYLVHGRFNADEIVSAIHDVSQGRNVLSPAVAPAVFNALRPSGGGDVRAAPQHYGVTEREREILDLLVQGLTNSAIAEQLVVTEKTVKNHINHIYSKLGVSSRAEAMALWLGVSDPREASRGR